MKQLTRIVLIACAGLIMSGADVKALLNSGDLQAKSGNYRGAAESYRAAIKLDPENAETYGKLADVYEHLGMNTEAAAMFAKSAEMLDKEAELLLAKSPAQQAAPPRQTQAPAAVPLKQVAAGGAAAGGGLDGLYFMTRFWPNTGLETATYSFHNGAVVRNPIAAGNSLDVQAERATHPNDVGTYSLSGGQLVMTLAGTPHTAKFEKETGGCFGWDAGVFCPVKTFKPGTTLDGTFTGGASVGGGAVMSSMTITFKPDGSYQLESAASFSSKGKVSNVSGGSTGGERGTYRINGNALTLMPQGGKQQVVSTFPYDDGSKGPEPRSIYFGGGMLKRAR